MRDKERSEFGQRLFEARTHARLTQPQLAKKAGMGQSTLAEAERIGQGSSYTSQLAEACGVRADWLATGRGPMIEPVKEKSSRGGTGPSMTPILAWEHEEDLPPGEFVMIPKLEVNLSAGPGRDQIEIELAEQTPLAFRSDWIRKMRLKPKKLAAMTATGRSMEPTIWGGDSLVVDTSQKEVIDGQVYALWYDGGERVKRLYLLPGGGIRIKSDNPEHPLIELGPDYSGHVRIIGRVVHRSGSGGL